jgi:hypothetical protein
MIQLNNLDKELVDVTTDELESVHGGDGFGAAIGAYTGFAAAGVASGGDPVKAVNGGVAGGSAGNLIPVAANPQIGIPAAVFVGTAVGIIQGISPSSMSSQRDPYGQNLYWQ